MAYEYAGLYDRYWGDQKRSEPEPETRDTDDAMADLAADLRYEISAAKEKLKRRAARIAQRTGLGRGDAYGKALMELPKTYERLQSCWEMLRRLRVRGY